MPEPKALRHPLWLALGVATAYYLAARLGMVLRFEPATTSVLWPPNALLTALLLLTPPGRWWIVLAAAFPAHLLIEAQVGFPISLVLALFVTNCSEALLAATMLRLWSDAPHRFDSLRRVTAFLAAAVLLAPFLTSFADAAAIHWLRGEEYWPVFRRRSFSNALSALTIVPSVVAVVRGRIGWPRDSTGPRRVAAALLCALIGGTALAVFAPGGAAVGSSLPGVPYTSLPFLVPALIWAAVRFGPGGASLGLLATTLATIRAATLGWKPFGLLTPEDSVVALQVFVCVVGVPLLYLGALIEERRLATSTLGERLRFEELLSRLSASFVHPPSHEMDRAFESALEQLGRFVGVDRITLRRFTPEGKLNVAYAWRAPQAPPAPGDLDRADFPWAAELLWGKAPIVVSDVDDMPAAAATEQLHLRRYGIRAVLVTPLVASEQVIGGLGYLANSAPRTWSQTTIEQSRLIADVFANAMARKQAEDAVRSSEATKTAVLGSLASHVAVLDRSGRILTVNESWARTSGDGSGDGLGGVGTNHLDLWAGQEARGLAEAREAMAGIRAVLGGSRQSFVLEYTCPAHPGIWYVMTVVPLRAPEGGAVVSLTDVTERKRAEIEAQKSRQELAHFLRVSTLGELTTSLAHELNQPLTAILANAQAAAYLVQDSTVPAAAQLREILADIAAEDRRAGEIIQRLRDLLRKAEPERLPLDMNAVAREVLGLLSSDALLRGVSLRFEAHAGPSTVHGDRVQLQQVLLNLVINAMEAMAGMAAEEAVVLVRTETIGEDRLGLRVEDWGPACAPPLRKRSSSLSTPPKPMASAWAFPSRDPSCWRTVARSRQATTRLGAPRSPWSFPPPAEPMRIPRPSPEATSSPFAEQHARERLVRGQPAVDGSGQERTHDRRYPEEPELAEGPSADEQGRAGAPSRVHRRVGHGDADEVDEGQSEADGDRGEARGRSTVSGPEDDQEEEEGQDGLGHESGEQGIAPRGMLGVTVGREAASGEIEAGFSAGDHAKDACARDGSEDLGHHVPGDMASREAAGGGETHRHRRVEVATRDVADGKGHGQHGEAKSKRNAEQPDADAGKRRREYGTPAASQHEPSRAQELRRPLSAHRFSPP